MDHYCRSYPHLFFRFRPIFFYVFCPKSFQVREISQSSLMIDYTRATIVYSYNYHIHIIISAVLQEFFFEVKSFTGDL